MTKCLCRVTSCLFPDSRKGLLTKAARHAVALLIGSLLYQLRERSP